MKGNLIIAQGGGPTAVINASVTGVVLEAFDRLDASGRVWGARHGIAGILDEAFIDMRDQPEGIWDEIRVAPAAALGSCRKKLTEEDVAHAVEVCKRHDIRYFFYVGGNDSMDTANKMSKAAQQAGYEMLAAGIPKTVDNDLPGTDFCPGYGSCARFFAQASIDLGMDIRSLPTPISIMEVMGRNAGWLTAATVLARKEPDDAPHLIYVPEVPLSKDRFLRDVKEVYDRQGWGVVAISEGVCDENGESLGTAPGETAVDGFGHKLPGDVAPTMAQLIMRELGLRARSEKPGIIGRASSHHVSSVDREAAEGVARFGARHVFAGNTDFMAAIRRESSDPLQISYFAVPLAEVANVEHLLPAEYIAESSNDITDGFREYAAPLIGGPLRRYARLIP